MIFCCAAVRKLAEWLAGTNARDINPGNSVSAQLKSVRVIA